MGALYVEYEMWDEDVSDSGSSSPMDGRYEM